MTYYSDFGDLLNGVRQCFYLEDGLRAVVGDSHIAPFYGDSLRVSFFISQQLYHWGIVDYRVSCFSFPMVQFLFSSLPTLMDAALIIISELYFIRCHWEMFHTSMSFSGGGSDLLVSICIGPNTE